MKNFIKASLYRGGTSKALLISDSEINSEQFKNIDDILLKIMGSPHKRQIDGIGCGDSLCSKVGIVRKSKENNIDIEYDFFQIATDKKLIDKSVNCGNIASAIAPFAINNKIISISPTQETITLNVKNTNTGVIFETKINLKNGAFNPDGHFKIDGVNTEASPIEMIFFNPIGSKTGLLLPTGKNVDTINGVDVTCIDVSVPMVIAQASSLGKTGKESKVELDKDTQFLSKLENIRLEAGKIMGLGDCQNSIIPKICIVSLPSDSENDICSRYFTPFDCHSTHAVSGAMCLAASLYVEDSVSSKLLKSTQDKNKTIKIEHPSGVIPVKIELEKNKICKAGFYRTAREIVSGKFYY